MQIIKDNTNVPPLKAKFVRIEEDGVTEQVCELPIEKNFNDGTGALYWINLGFTPYDEYMSKKHGAEVKKQQEEALKAAEEAAAKAAEEAKKAQETAAKVEEPKKKKAE